MYCFYAIAFMQSYTSVPLTVLELLLLCICFLMLFLILHWRSRKKQEIFPVKFFFGRSICKIFFLKFWVIIHLRTFNVARVIASPILKVMRMKKSRFKNFPDRKKKFFLQILVANIFPEILSHHAPLYL